MGRVKRNPFITSWRGADRLGLLSSLHLGKTKRYENGQKAQSWLKRFSTNMDGCLKIRKRPKLRLARSVQRRITEDVTRFHRSRRFSVYSAAIAENILVPCSSLAYVRIFCSCLCCQKTKINPKYCTKMWPCFPRFFTPYCSILQNPSFLVQKKRGNVFLLLSIYCDSPWPGVPNKRTIGWILNFFHRWNTYLLWTAEDNHIRLQKILHRKWNSYFHNGS